MMCALLVAVEIFFTGAPGFAEDAIGYRQFKISGIVCDTGVAYMTTGSRRDIAVSAIAYSSAMAGSWSITDMTLVAGDTRISPAQTGKFYAQHGPLLKYPAAVIYEAMGMNVDAPGPGPKKGVTRTNAGPGLLTLPSNGDVTGVNSIFSVDSSVINTIDENRDVIEITIEEKATHRRELVRMPLANVPAGEIRYDYGLMRPDELMQMMDTLDLQAATLRKNQQNFKPGKDPEFDELQKKIELLEVERGMIFRIRLDREKVDR